MRGVLILFLIFVIGMVFAVALFLMFLAPCSCSIQPLLGSVRVGGVWNGFLLGRVRGQPVPCQFCGAPDGDGHLFGECTFRPLVEIRENPETHDLIRMDKGDWPRCLLWHGWLRLLSGVNRASSWADDASESAGQLLEVALGSYSSWIVSEWSVPDGFDAVEAASRMPDVPNVWTDGCLALDKVTGVSSSGSVFFFFAHQSELSWRARTWGQVGHVRPVGCEGLSCRRFCSVPGSLQTVQRAELWCVILALQSSDAVHLGAI